MSLRPPATTWDTQTYPVRVHRPARSGLVLSSMTCLPAPADTKGFMIGERSGCPVLGSRVRGASYSAAENGFLRLPARGFTRSLLPNHQTVLCGKVTVCLTKHWSACPDCRTSVTRVQAHKDIFIKQTPNFLGCMLSGMGVTVAEI